MDEYVLEYCCSDGVFKVPVTLENPIYLSPYTNINKFLKCCGNIEFRNRYFHPRGIWFKEHPEIIHEIFKFHNISGLSKYFYDICDYIIRLKLSIKLMDDGRLEINTGIVTKSYIIGGPRYVVNDIDSAKKIMASLGFRTDLVEIGDNKYITTMSK